MSKYIRGSISIHEVALDRFLTFLVPYSKFVSNEKRTVGNDTISSIVSL
ncbi:MAG TPA: hypothetical protein PLC31_06450 [Fervidobacterium sp.]|nr:hypothetical protein [Fervidobacterium sp.]